MSKTWSLKVREEHRFRVFENKVLGRSMGLGVVRRLKEIA
jgi:hypothetical protein